MKNLFINIFGGISFLFFISCNTETPTPVSTYSDTSSTPAHITSTTHEVTAWAYQSPYHYTNLYIPSITNNTIQSSAIMVYFSKKGENIWTALPFTQYGTSTNYIMGFNTRIGNVQITWVYNSLLSKGNSPNEFYNADTLEYKVVVLSRSARMAHPKIDLTNYEEVKKTFDLSE